MTRRHRSALVAVLAAFALLLVAPRLAAAQTAPGPAPAAAARVRHGLFGGIGLYAGNISCDGANCGDFREAGGAGGHLGWMFYPRLGVFVDAWAMTSKQNDVSISYVSGAIGARYWVANPLWLQAGIGNGHAEIRVGGLSARGEDVPALMLGAGLELLRGPSWALDIEAKVAWGSETDAEGDVSTGRMAAIGASLIWYSH